MLTQGRAYLRSAPTWWCTALTGQGTGGGDARGVDSIATTSKGRSVDALAALLSAEISEDVLDNPQSPPFISLRLCLIILGKKYIGVRVVRERVYGNYKKRGLKIFAGSFSTERETI